MTMEKEEAASGGWLKSLGLGVSTAVAGFWLVIGIGGLIEGEVASARATMLTVLYLDAAVSAGVAWWRQGLGGLLLLGSGMILSGVTVLVPGGAHDHGPTLLTGGVPLAVSGLLLLIAQRLEARAERE